MRTRNVLTVVLLASLVALTSCKPSDDEQQLLREASIAWEAALGITSTEPVALVARWEALADVQDRLLRIARLHPESSVAQALAQGEAMDGISVVGVREKFRSVSETIQDCAECQLELFLTEARRIDDKPDQLSALLAVAEKFRSARVLDEALSVADSIYGHFDSADIHDSSIRLFIETAAKAGFPESAFDALDALDSQNWRSASILHIARAQAEAGYVEEAMTSLSIARTLITPDAFPIEVPEAVARGAIARALALQGRQTEAISMVGSIILPDMRNHSILELADILEDTGNWQLALSIIEPVPADYKENFGKYSKSSILGELATAQARDGQLEPALDTVASISDATGRTKALGAVAVAQAQSGAFDAALATAERVEDWYRPVVLSRIVVAQAEAGLVEEALELVASIGVTGPDPLGSTSVPAWDERPDAYMAISIAQARAGDWPAALETARGIRDQWPFSKKVEALAELGVLGSDPELFDEAFEYAARARERIAMDFVVEAEASAGYWLDSMTKVRLSYPLLLRDEQGTYSSTDQLEGLRAVLRGMNKS